jgi:hypothetical protein
MKKFGSITGHHGAAVVVLFFFIREKEVIAN